MNRRWWYPLLLLLTAGIVSSCDSRSAATTSDISVSALQRPVQAALEDLDRARVALPDDPAEATTALEASRLKLRQLNEYYLPLLAARHQVTSALTVLDSDSAPAAVDSAEALLLGIVRGHGRHLEKEMTEPLERLEDARVALEARDKEEARRVLSRLRDDLASIFFRGNLVLQDSELDPETQPSTR